MTGSEDLMKLYSKRILALASDIPHLDRLAEPQATARKRSPLCGSTVTVDINVTDGRISSYGQDVKACALGQAAAAVIGAVIIGCDRQDVETGRAALHAMLTQDRPEPDAPFDGLNVLLPAKDFRNRHASIMLTFDAILDALDIAEHGPQTQKNAASSEENAAQSK